MSGGDAARLRDVTVRTQVGTVVVRADGEYAVEYSMPDEPGLRQPRPLRGGVRLDALIRLLPGGSTVSDPAPPVASPGWRERVSAWWRSRRRAARAVRELGS